MGIPQREGVGGQMESLSGPSYLFFHQRWSFGFFFLFYLLGSVSVYFKRFSIGKNKFGNSWLMDKKQNSLTWHLRLFQSSPTHLFNKGSFYFSSSWIFSLIVSIGLSSFHLSFPSPLPKCCPTTVITSAITTKYFYFSTLPRQGRTALLRIMCRVMANDIWL